MKFDIITAGVGGQGVLSVAAIIAAAAERAGIHAVQSEVHGMSQRGGAVISHLRLSTSPIYSALLGRGDADLIISMEPLEALRYLESLSPTGTVVAATDVVKNIADYPDQEELFSEVRRLPNSILVDAGWLAREAGNAKAANTVMVGAAAHLLPIPLEVLQAFILEAFAEKGEKVACANLEAFEAGRCAVANQHLVDEYDLSPLMV